MSGNRIADVLVALLDPAARHGPLLLIAGLAAGIASPALALAAKPWIPEMIAALLFLAALRVGPRRLVGVARDLGQSLIAVFVFQLSLPLALALAFLAAGWSGPLPTALVLMAAAAPISGSPSLTVMTGNDPAPALRIMSLGTALLPLTVVPVFWLTPALGEAEILSAVGRLFLVILAAVSAAFVIRALLQAEPGPRGLRSIDGISAIVMAAVVVGLMSAVGEALFTRPAQLALNLAIAFAASFMLQLTVASVLRRRGPSPDNAALAIVAGNRNIALFLTALPLAVTDPLLLFIGCYQIPMYLTPLLLGRFYRPPAGESTSR